MQNTTLQTLLAELGARLMAQGLRCAVAESCTGGLMGAALTSVAGASQWFSGGVIAYANEVKMNVLGVEEDVLRAHGAVSAACVRHMASGVCRLMHVEVGVSISGVAGPGGGTAEKPVGTVWLGFSILGKEEALLLRLEGTREDIRQQVIFCAVQELLTRL